MVICTYSVHITMANFLQYFKAKINRSTSQVAHFMFGKIFSACCRYLFHLKQNILPKKCLVVTSSYRDHVTIYRLGFQISKRLIFPYHSKTNEMLFSDKSFCLFEINGLPLPPKNFTILTQKIKPVEEWKDTRVNCQYQAGFLGFQEHSSFRIILKRTQCFFLTNLFAFLG